MIDQRGKVEGQGLPRTACAPDLFTRIDALKAGQTGHEEWPVRFYLGFGTPLPNFQMLRGDGFVWQVVVALGGKPQDGAILRRGKDLATGILIIVIWCLGFLADVMTTAKLNLGGKNDPAVREISADIAAKELTARLSGSDPSWATAIDQGARNYLSPQQTIDAGQAVSAYLANTIDVTAVHDYSRFAGVCDVATDIQIDVAQQRPAGQQLIDLYYRGIIDRRTADDQYRQLGFLKSQYVEWEHELHKYQNQPVEWITWARFGVLSEDLAKRLDLDADLGAAWNDQAKKWARAAGYSDEQAKWLWRGQYQPLDPMTAGDWYRRDVAGWWQDGEEFTEEDLDLAISQSTLPPAYRELQKQAIWQPISSRLLRTAYNESIVDETAIRTALIVDGRRPEDAEVILAEWRALKPKYVAGKIGAPMIGKLQSLYADGVIGTAEFTAGAQQLGLAGAEVQAGLAAAVQARTHKHRSEVIGKLKGQYLAGAIDDSTVKGVLGTIGLSLADANDLAGLWRIEFEVSPRTDSGSALVGYYKQGLIDESDLVASLTQLRYTPVQIARMIGAADLVSMGKSLAAAEKLVAGAKARLAADAKEWAGKIAQAEKLVGTVGQRIVTRAGKQMAWVKTYVTGTPTPLSKKKPTAGVHYAESKAATAAAADFVEDGSGGTTVPGEGLESLPAEQPQAASDQPAATPPDQSSGST